MGRLSRTHRRWQARSRCELIDFSDSNPYSPIEAVRPDGTAMPRRSQRKMGFLDMLKGVVLATKDFRSRFRRSTFHAHPDCSPSDHIGNASGYSRQRIPPFPLDFVAARTGRFPKLGEFYLQLPSRFDDILSAARPKLESVFSNWLQRGLPEDLFSELKLAGFGLRTPRQNRIKWDVSFEATGAKWLGIIIPFEGDKAMDAVVDT